MTDEYRRTEERIPLVEEHAQITKRGVEIGRVRIRTFVDERTELLRDAVTREDVEIARIRVDRPVEAAPEMRIEGDTTILSVVEEVIVVEKRLVVREEIHIRKRVTVEPVEHAVNLRATRAVVEREGNGQESPQPPNQE